MWIEKKHPDVFQPFVSWWTNLRLDTVESQVMRLYVGLSGQQFSKLAGLFCMSYNIKMHYDRKEAACLHSCTGVLSLPMFGHLEYNVSDQQHLCGAKQGSDE